MERLKSPLVKAEFIADVFETSEYIYFLKSYQYRNNIEQIPQNLKTKLSKEYWQGIYSGEGMVYENLGFTRETTALGNKAGISIAQSWVEENIDWNKMKYLDKIVELCERESVRLFFVSTPLTISTVYATPGYNECVDYFTEYAAEKNVPYDNLNLLKGREEFLPDALMNCMEHVGNEGADIISDYYCKVLNARIQGESVEQYFFSSVDEMRENMKAIVACQLRTEQVDENGNRKIIGEIVGKTDARPEYQFEIEKDGKVCVLQQYSQMNTCSLPVEKISFPMILRVRCRDKSDMMHEKISENHIEETTWYP